VSHWVRRLLIYITLVVLYNITDYALGGAIPDSYTPAFVACFVTLAVLVVPKKG
jgi:hypothetical protein